MTDIYAAAADEFTDHTVSQPALLDPVSEKFAADSDVGYGEWMPGIGEDFRGDGSAERPPDENRSDLDALNEVMAGHSMQGLLSADRRGEYVFTDDHTDEDTDDHRGDEDGRDSGPAMSFGAFSDATTPRKSRRLNWSRRSHRIAAAIAVAVPLVLILTLLTSSGGNDKSENTPAAAPAYTVPTITKAAPSAAAPPSAGTPDAADGPIGIKRADSRCTAGSTDAMQAFDNDLATAWMCVPAYTTGEGTVLRVEFDNWYVITGASIVPGWNKVNADGSDEWLEHRTVAVVEYQFNDPEQTRLTQSTLNVRDDVVTAVDPPVLASAMTITIRETAAPTGPVADVTSAPGIGGIIESDTPATGDLKDFAVSSFSVIGHRAR
ncbi:hypothetical protein ACRCUN_23395 [Mycobacterium sp. LTG2003]